MYSYEEAEQATLEYFDGDQFATDIFLKKYALRDNNDNLLEKTPSDMHKRLAKEFARIEKTKFKDPLTEEQIFDLFDRFKWIVPQGSVMFGCGNPYQYSSLSNCFISGTKVLTEYGIKNIENINLEDKIVTHNGTLQKVVQLHHNKLNDRQLFEIKCFYTPKFVVTNNHKFLSISKEQIKWNEQPTFNTIDYLRVGDYVAITKINENECLNMDLFDITQLLNSNFEYVGTKYELINQSNQSQLITYFNNNTKICKKYHKLINNKWYVDNNFAYFLGLWYGDGCIFSTSTRNFGHRDRKSIKDRKIRGITFTFGAHETKLIDFVSNYGQKLFGINADINNNAHIDGSCQIVFHSTLIGLMFEKLFGRKCDGKILNNQIFKWNKNLVESLIQGLIDSDGCITKAGDVRVTLKNIQLMEQFYYLLRLHSIVVGLTKGIKQTYGRLDFPRGCDFIKNSNKFYNDNRIKTTYQFHNLENNTIYRDGYWFVKINQKNKINTNDNIVYTLGIENIHSYNVHGLICENCYFCEIPQDSYSSILDIDKQIVNISKRRGGVGIRLDNLRPRGFPTKNAAKSSTGIVSFAKRYSNTINEVCQNGRRGALMICLSVHHPDILEFIKAKENLTEITGANLSILLSDEFLESLSNNLDYELRFPVDYKEKNIQAKISKQISSKLVWDQIIKSVWKCAEPGLLFEDNIKKYTPADSYEQYVSKGVNPCCLAKSQDTFVVTKNGIKEIKTISEKDEIWINKHKVWTKTNGYQSYGKDIIYKVKFHNNEELLINKTHKLCKIHQQRIGTKLEYIEGELTELQKLKIGDKISLHTTIVNDTLLPNTGTYEEGVILGWLTGNGCLSFTNDRQHYPTMCLSFWQQEYDVAHKIHEILTKLGYDLTLYSNKINKTLNIRSFKITKDFINKYQFNVWLFKSKDLYNPFLFNCSIEFIKGFLSSYFSTNGTVQHYNMQLCSINHNLLKQVKQLLLLFGIQSTIGLSKKQGITIFPEYNKTHKTNDCYRLSITGLSFLQKFLDNIGFLNEIKNNKLKEICKIKTQHKSKTLNYTTITSIEEIGIDEIGCINTDIYHTFTANGIISGNSEISLSELDSCRLMLLNLLSFVIKPYTSEAKFDFKLFSETVYKAQQLMDDLVDLESEKIDQIIQKIESDPEPIEIKNSELLLWQKIKSNNDNGRRTGLGTTALADTLAALNIKYDSKESITICDKIFKTLKYSAYWSSINMAEILGSFTGFDFNKEEHNAFIQRFQNDKLIIDEEHILDGNILLEHMKKYGRRNVALLTSSPAGSVSALTQTSSGIEPVFKLEYTRRRKIEDKAKADFIDKNRIAWQEYKVIHQQLKKWQNLNPALDITKSPWYNCCANDISYEKKIELQATIQQHICHSISNTLNVPNNTTEQEIDQIYRLAWKKKLKGITIYRQGSRDGVLIENKESKENDNKIKKRPKELPCHIYHISVKHEPYTILIGLMNDRPYEIFSISNNGIIDQTIKTGKIVRKKKNFYQLVIDAETTLSPITAFCSEKDLIISRLLSLSLRSGIDLNIVIEQIEKASEFSPIMGSLGKAINRCLKKYIQEGEEIGDCPVCKVGRLIKKDGCMECINCSEQRCS